MPTKCKSCGGTYEPLQSSGRYFHACPPVATVTVKRGNATVDVAMVDVLPDDVEQSRRYAERADKRDENVIGDGPNPSAIKAEGKGAVAV